MPDAVGGCILVGGRLVFLFRPDNLNGDGQARFNIGLKTGEKVKSVRRVTLVKGVEGQVPFTMRDGMLHFDLPWKKVKSTEYQIDDPLSPYCYVVVQCEQPMSSWKDAIAAYRRVITEFPTGNWIKDAKWSIAECTINLSQWREAMDGYEAYVRDYPGDGKVTEAKRRVGILKDLVRYQTLVDEKGQRKAFDAQYQIATIVLKQLSNRIKAIIEYRKVAANWSDSHLADDALYAVATTYPALIFRE